MRITVIFVLLLNSVTEVSPDVDGCLGGWFELNCTYPQTETPEINQNLTVLVPKGRPLKGNNFGQNKWGVVDNQRSLYHNTTGKYWRVLVKQLNKGDLDDYECKNGPTGKIELEDDHTVACPESSQISDSGANTTIICTHPMVNFICKESSPSCDILVRGQKPVHHIINVTTKDQGDYWCGYESQSKSYKVSRQNLHLQVVEVTKRSLKPGQDLIHSCNYKNVAFKKFVCKGENTTVCPEIVSTSNKSNGRFSLKSVRQNLTVILTIQSVTMKDSGSYWCGTERSSIRKENQFSHKLELTVAQIPLTTSPFSPDGLQRTLIIAATVCGVILLLVLIVFCIHKIRSSFTNTTPANKEEHCYEEIQERHRQIGSGTALKTVYATASAPQPASSGPDKTGNTHKKSDETFKDNVLYSTSGPHRYMHHGGK